MMNTSSTWLRPLQALAVVLGIAIAGLLVAWFRIEVPPPSFAAETPPPAPADQDRAATGEVGSPRSGAEEVPAPSRAPADAGVTAQAPTAAVLYGTIRRADATAIESGFCWLQRDGKQSGTARLDRGAFAFSGLQPGVFRLTSRIPDELELDREVVVQAPATRLDIELLPRWLLRVDAVTADGAPLGEALQKQKRGTWFRTLRALAFQAPLAGDLQGSSAEREAGLGPFRANDPMMRERTAAAPLPKQTIGVLTLPSDQQAHVALLLGGTLLAQQPASPGQEAITFVVGCDAVFGKLGTVRLRWVDTNGAPVAGAPVIVSSGSGSSRAPNQVTDEDGRYTASDLLPGRVGFGVYRQGLITPPLRIELAPGANLDLGDITMQKAVEVELSFENFGGEGGVQIFWLDAPPNSIWQPTDNYRPAQTARLQKTPLFPGRYALIARSKSGVAVTEIDTRSLAPGPMRFDLVPGAPLQIDNRIGTGLARLEIATARGLPVHQSELGSRRSFTLQLPPGDYVATVRERTGEPKRHAFHLPSAGTVLAVP